MFFPSLSRFLISCSGSQSALRVLPPRLRKKAGGTVQVSFELQDEIIVELENYTRSNKRRQQMRLLLSWDRTPAALNFDCQGYWRHQFDTYKEQTVTRRRVFVFFPRVFPFLVDLSFYPSTFPSLHFIRAQPLYQNWGITADYNTSFHLDH